jgi:ribose transport system ATP-binding protein
MPALLQTTELDKSFFGIHALRSVSLSVEEGGILGLVGENGAGKSTLMNIIGGVVQPSGGTMQLGGEAYAPGTPAEATAAGIAFIHQELNLFTNLTVAENIFIDGFPRRFGLIDRSAMRRRTAELLKTLELDAKPDTRVDSLAPGERQLVEIAKALHLDARLIIFDEPTTSLTKRETDRLFRTIERLRGQGKTMIYISHVLGDVMRLANSVAVLRDGALVTQGPGSEFDIPKIIRLMIGRELKQLFPPRTGKPSDDVVLELSNVSQPGIVNGVSFAVRRGEILGLFGLMGSGRSELARIVFGLDPFESGSIRMNGQALSGHTPSDSIRHGIAFVTENRRDEGLMMESAIADNIALVSVNSFARTPLRIVERTRLGEAASAIAAELKIKAGDIRGQPVKSLSGGNQQKVVIGKWLLSEPGLFILDEPTRGVDVGAKYEIYSIADQIAASGNGILFISSELEELMGLCDRILVMSHGEVQREFTGGPFRQEDILRAAFREDVAA